MNATKHGPKFARPNGVENYALRKGTMKMTEFLIMIGILAVWIALQAWILPRMGVQT